MIVGFNFLLEFVDDREKSLIRYNNTYTSTIIYLALALSIFLVITLIIFSFILLDQVRVIDILSYQPILISKHEIMALYNKYWQMAPNSQQIVSYHTLSFTAYYNINLLILVVISFAVHFVFMFVSVVIHQNIVQQDLSIYNLAISMPIFRSSLFFIAMLNFDRDKISIMKHNILREYAALQSLNTDSDYQNNNSFHDNVVINCFHPEHIYPLQTMHFWPLNDKSISIEFSDYISQVAIILYEIQFSTHNGIYQSSIDPLIQLPITSLALKNSAKESYNFKTTITIMEAIVAFLLYFILQVIIFASEIVMITDIHSTFNLMARLLCLMPQKSPFFEIPIDLERPMPDSHDSDLMENMSNGIIVCDSSFTIRRMNSTAKCMFGSKYKGKKIQKVPEKVVDPISGKTKYYSIHLCTRAQNPIDDFERRLFNDRTLCFIINDMSQAFTLKTKITNMKNEKLYLINELLPSSIEMIRNESIRMVVKFAIVEISFSKEFKQFEKFTEDVTKVSEQFSTLFLLTTKRFSFFAIFVNFSTGGNSRQFIREAISFVTRIMGFAFNFAKASLVLGDRCLLMDEKSENMHFELFSQALMMSAALLRLANIGEIVSDYNIFKSVKNPSIQISRVGTQLILSDYYEFCVVSIQI
ncbi:hypothetical protein TRFO_22950 [Tritrichomonas foetus]|uniref:PAS domain-containing protein n=1 Tax=Tritrichomonas foetus TaxID=1144522 RepID=A0A1J4KBC2_9EUKA|nr:hypothetical protein TRFO_22950 [Tritrichomonas foetus]|eukprot:OHT08523.1 hypothetical protein TRFO_22950 [Tritrichomonas foetus]